ncbi:hypothetical protein FB45DRAFT_1054362 [Roridomyces roridus]|uniref:TEA domain-containing protein n=1 Tax=Roridomyces roridus TaxID=1738132 RepID=A0AAD7C8X2_9AGAR|nr:hypothetical protein FB45DRAFT_1054362 [Roridomyces roridus]
MPRNLDLVRATSSTPALLHSVLGGRRCRKATLSGEEVWPVHLEAAMLEGLANYVPDESRETRILGRFRGRNRFISDYIFAKTGERRTNKQVGSRLQQLRHCSTDPELRRLLLPMGHSSLTALCLDRGSFGSQYSMDNEYTASKRMTISISMHTLPFTVTSIGDSYTSTHAADAHRKNQLIAPTVTLISSHPVSAQSYFSVWYGKESRCVHTEIVPLVVLEDKPANGTLGCLHSSMLVPAFWRQLVTSPDPTQFVITQDVVKDGHWASAVVFSAEYRFVP